MGDRLAQAVSKAALDGCPEEQMTGKALRALRKSLGMSTAAAADLVHVSRRTWVAWEARKVVPETGAELFRLKVGKEAQ